MIDNCKRFFYINFKNNINKFYNTTEQRIIFIRDNYIFYRDNKIE